MVGTVFTPIGEWSKLHDRVYRCGDLVPRVRRLARPTLTGRHLRCA